MDRVVIASVGKWAQAAGGSQAVKTGNTVEISGMLAIDEKGRLVGTSAFEQTRAVIQKIERVLHECGASLKDVIHTRLYVTDIELWKEYARAHAEFFRDIQPATTIVEVRRLIQPEFLVAIDATAVIVN